MSSPNDIYQYPTNPYQGCKPGNADAKRLSVDVPIEVHKRISDMMAFRGFWKLYLSRCIFLFDQIAQGHKITTLTYPLSQRVCMMLVEELTKPENFNDETFKQLLTETRLRSRPTFPKLSKSPKQTTT